MTDIITLLTLPKTSKAFTALRSTAVDNSIDDGSASPPRKTPRLDADSDSGSASRSRNQSKDKAPARGKTTRIQITGEPVAAQSDKLHDQLFAQLRRCIRTLLTKDTAEDLPVTYEGIYSACRSVVCVSNRGEGLYENLKIELEQCVGRLAQFLVEGQKLDIEWINDFNDVCGWFERQTALLQSLLTYLDRVYVLKQTKLPNIHVLSYSLFADRVFRNPQITERLRTGIKDWIKHERDYKLQHELRPNITALVAHILTHGHYSPVFESFYLECTTSYYTEESLNLSQSLGDNAKEFLKQTNFRIGEEQDRSIAILPEFSWGGVRVATERALLTGRLDWLAKKAIDPLMEERDIRELSKTYSLFARVDGLKTLCAAFKNYILTKIQGIVKDVEHDEDMVQNLLDFKKFADSTLSASFADTNEPVTPPASTSSASTSQNAPKLDKHPNQEFVYALRDAFQMGFKARRNKPAEMIAKYLDRAMRKGQRGASDADFEALLESALALYRFTDDKDVFRTFYQRALAKRLLLERSASDDFEKAILKKLKEQYDPEFGMGDHMFTDLALSREIMLEYHAKLSEDSPAHKLTVMVLQRSVWPFAARKKDVDLPPSMQADLTRYSTFYKVKHQGHKLEWDHALGTATLKARFKTGPKDLSVSLYQAVVLLLFNDAVEVSFKEIAESTRMDDAELRRTLQSLACANKKVLKKRPVGKDVNDDDVFYFNADFTDPRAKVHINSIQSKETPEESKRTQTSIEGDRKHYLDAAIVRIMKARKELSYEQLKTATIDAVKSHFVPEVSSIKQRIQGLVEQEYLRRDEDDMNMYIYVA